MFVTNLQKVPVVAARKRLDDVFSVCSCLFYAKLQSLQFDPLGRAAAHHSYNPQWVNDIDAVVTLTARGKD